MFSVFRELQAPQGVTHAVRGRFWPTPPSVAVVFARKNSLDTFVVRANSETARLECLSSLSLGANIVSLAVLRRAPSHDILCVSFERMRVSLLSWNTDALSWNTHQILDFGDLLGTPSCSPTSIALGLDRHDKWRPVLRGTEGSDSYPLIRTDPVGRCFAVLSIQQNVLYIVPARSEDESLLETRRTVDLTSVFVVDLLSDYEACNVKDFLFIDGTFEPSVAILYESKRTWAGRAAVQRNTASLLCLSVDLRSKRFSKTWKMEDFPYDSHKLEAVPESARGGVLLLSASVIMHIRHGRCIAGLSLNCFGDAYAAELKQKYDAIVPSDTLVECDAAHCRFLDAEEAVADTQGKTRSIALLSLKGGELYFLHIAAGTRTALVMKRAGSTVIASEIVPVNERFFVLSSRLSDSLLVEYKSVMDDNATLDDPKASAAIHSSSGNARNEGGGKPGNNKKRKRTAEEEAEYEMIYGVKPPDDFTDDESDADDPAKKNALELEEKDEGTRGVYDDEDELGFVFNSDSTASKRTGFGSWALKVKDTLPCFGPGADITVGRSPSAVNLSTLDMLVAGGYAKNGCLAVVHQTVRPTKQTEFTIPKCTGVWTLCDNVEVCSRKHERSIKNGAISERNKELYERNARILQERERYVQECLAELSQNQRNAVSGEDEGGRKQEPMVDGDDHSGLGSADVTATNGTHTPFSGPPLATTTSENDQPTGREEPEQDSRLTPEVRVSPDVPRAEPQADGPTDTAPVGSNPGSGASLSGHEKDDISTPIEHADCPSATKRPRLRPPFDCTAKIEEGKHSDATDEDILHFRRQAEASFPLEEEEQLEEEIADENALHSYMLLSTDRQTTVLKTGLDLEEAHPGSHDFVTQEKTICAGNVLNRDAIVQVVPSSVKVLSGGKVECAHIAADGEQIVNAEVCDPLVLFHTETNNVTVLRVISENIPYDDTGGTKDEFGVLNGPTNAHVEQDVNNDGNDRRHQTNGNEGHLKRLSLQVEFRSKQRSELSEEIACACIYHGAFAKQLSRELNTNTGREENVAMNKAESEVPDGNTGDDPVQIETVDQSGMAQDSNTGRSHEVDVDDRILYGEDASDDDEHMLYGASTPQHQEFSKEGPSQESAQGWVPNQPDAATKPSDSLNPSSIHGHERGVLPLPETADSSKRREHLLVIVTTSGKLLILARDTLYTRIFQCSFLFVGPAFMTDDGELEVRQKGQSPPAASLEYRVSCVKMSEIGGSGAAAGLSTVVLAVTSQTGIPLLYKAFLMQKSASQKISRLSFKRVIFKDSTTNLFTRCMKAKSVGRRQLRHTRNESRIFPFQNVSGRSGVFIGGVAPSFTFSERGQVRVHEMGHVIHNHDTVSKEEYETAQGMSCFAEFHNLNCPRGFVTVGFDEMVRIFSLPPPSAMHYDAPMPFRKVSLRCTPHKVAYHVGSATYGVLASMPTLTTREERLARILQSLEKHDKRHYQHTAAQAEAETGDERADRVPPLFEELHELRVYRPDTWDLIKSHKLQKGEVGLAITNMSVDVYKQRMASSRVDIPSSRKGDDGNESMFAASVKLRPKDLLVVGTGYLNGEDASSRGRLLLFEISRQEVYTDTGVSYTAFQLQLIAEKELFSPVTAVAAMEGFVIVGVGPQVSVYKLVGDEIIHLSFAFGQLYCPAIASLKQYVLIADMCKSVTLMYFRERNNSVNFLGRDYEQVSCFATEFLIEGENVSVIVSDSSGNVRLLNYAHASVAESRGGKRLLLNGGVHIGSRITKFVRVRVPDNAREVNNGNWRRSAGNQVLLFVTVDGGIGMVVGVTEEDFKLYQSMRAIVREYAGVKRHAGVNDEEQTTFRNEGAGVEMLEQRVLDSRMVMDLFGLTLIEQKVLTHRSGHTMTSVLDAFSRLDAVVNRF